MEWSRSFLRATAAVAAALACAGTPPPAPPAEPVASTASDSSAAPTLAAVSALSDARVLELGRGYAALLQAREYDRLWEHLTPEAQARLGSAASFRSWAEQNRDGLGDEQSVIRESVELPRPGMRADRLYLRVSRHAEVPARLVIGLRNDGSIVGMQLRRGN